MNQDMLSQNLPRVAILLATYNPNEDIFVQIQSLRDQDYPNIIIYWGDDGSTPYCLKIIELALRDLEVIRLPQNQVGPTRNFLNLVKAAANEEYLAFCDQDDYWEPFKISKHVKALQSHHNIPACTHSTSFLFGKEVKQRSQIANCPEHKLEKLMVENCFQGCTMVLNKRAAQLLINFDMSDVIWHDWWVGLVISNFGISLYIEGTDTYYRIHNANAIGVPNIRKRLRNYFARPPGIQYRQNIALLRMFLHFERFDEAGQVKIWLRNYSHSRAMRLFYSFQEPFRRSKLLEEILRRISGILKQP